VVSIGAITNVGVSDITGDVGHVGVVSGLTVPPNQVVGDILALSATSPVATGIVTAYNEAIGRVNTEPSNVKAGAIVLGGVLLGGAGRPFTSGVYTFGAAVALSGDVYFDGGVDDIFILQTAGALTQAAGIKMVPINGARAANIYWATTGATAIAANAHVEGNLLCFGAISLGVEVTLNGRVRGLAAVS
jgi:hypothetical protein